MNPALMAMNLFNPPLADTLSAFRMSNFSGQAIVVILFIGSIFAWSVMATKLLEMARAARGARQFAALYHKSRHPLELFIQKTAVEENPLSALYEAVSRDLAHAMQAQTAEALMRPAAPMQEYQARALRNLAEQIMAEQALLLERNMIFLATAVTAAPFLGLLGTVWGIMDAFGGLALSGMATMAAVAPGVSGALLTTVVGLVVALPSAIGYNILTGKIRNLNIRMEHFTQEFLADIEQQFMAH